MMRMMMMDSSRDEDDDDNEEGTSMLEEVDISVVSESGVETRLMCGLGGALNPSNSMATSPSKLLRRRAGGVSPDTNGSMSFSLSPSLCLTEEGGKGLSAGNTIGLNSFGGMTNSTFNEFSEMDRTSCLLNSNNDVINHRDAKTNNVKKKIDKDDNLEPEIDLTENRTLGTTTQAASILNDIRSYELQQHSTNKTWEQKHSHTTTASSSSSTDEADDKTNFLINRLDGSPGIRSTFQAPYRPPTKLHELCNQAKTVQDLQQVRSQLLNLRLPRRDILNFARVSDGKGCTPLHLVSENTAIAEHLDSNANNIIAADKENDIWLPDIATPKSFSNTPDASRELIVQNFILDFLLVANPRAAMSRDNDGKIPFERCINEWIIESYDSMVHMAATSRRDSFAPKVVLDALRSTAVIARSSGLIGSKRHSTAAAMDGSTLQSPPEKSTSLGLSQDPSSGRKETPGATRNTSEGPARKRCFPIHVCVSSQLVFALKMLSAIMGRLDKLASSSSSNALPTPPPSRRNNIRAKTPKSIKEVDSFDHVMDHTSFFQSMDDFTYDEIQEEIVSNIASIPDFVKLVLLIENDHDREFALSTTIMRRVLMSKLSVGGWLPAMLRCNQRRVSDRAVDYLEIVSNLATCEKISTLSSSSSSSTNNGSKLAKSTSSARLNRAERLRDDFHTEISYLQDFVPSLMALGEKKMGEAATTMVVRRVMDRIIARPFAVLFILCDAAFLVLLIYGFRDAVNKLLVKGNPNAVLRSIYIANTGIFYFVIREIGKVISMRMIGRTRALLSFWNLADLTATMFAFVSIMAIRSIQRPDDGLDIIDMHSFRNFLAVTTGLLWLRVLNLLKGINMQMATFILAILQITKDTLTFGVILLTMILTFSQMFYTVLVPDYCSDPEAREMDDPDFRCDQAEYIFRVYTILLGDFGAFERETFQTRFAFILLIFYSFMVIIVLLNVLIAVASDSYEKCLLRSNMLFGRARVMLIAEIVCFQNLLRKIPNDGSQLVHQKEKPSLSSDRWWWLKSCAQGWSRGSLVFFGLSSMVVVFWAFGEMAGYFSGDQRYGNVAVSMASVLVNVFVFAAMMAFLSQGAQTISSRRSQMDIGDTAAERKGGFLVRVQSMILRVMGSSQDSWTRKKQDDKKEHEWRGRVHHLQSRIDKMAQEANERSVAQAQGIEQMVAVTELRLKKDISELSDRLEYLHSGCMSDLKQTQEEALKQIQECLSKSLVKQS
ncbi:Potassium ion channel Yvc1 [Seminavis robusta]|uniref:Potassium ion channel Yvc1 n=1 Tax=Seminavis robusta TaxID=568900 RepID=A0A9N8DHE7_9STRA|nr:Potassium ion channel Yvc1 [Seminavis robusta]|eukprot:Sro154_g070120.1 Potassium ion channel Yvc1 (1229) ;mRNA; r:71040-74883